MLLVSMVNRWSVVRCAKDAGEQIERLRQQFSILWKFSELTPKKYHGAYTFSFFGTYHLIWL